MCFGSRLPLTSFVEQPIHFAGRIARFILHRRTIDLVELREIDLGTDRFAALPELGQPPTNLVVP